VKCVNSEIGEDTTTYAFDDVEKALDSTLLVLAAADMLQP
jgi:hypothetical protein